MWNNENENLDNKNSAVPAWGIDTNNSHTEQKDNFDEAKKEAEKTQAETKEWSEALQGSVVDAATAKQESKSNTYIAKQETQSTIDLETYKWYTEVLTQLIYEIDWCIQTAKYTTWLNQSWKQTLKTAKEKLKQYKDIIKDKKRMIEHEFNAKNRLNSNNPNRSPLEVNISKAETNELKNKRFRRRQQIEYDIKQWQSWKSSNTAPWPNQSLEQVLAWNHVDETHNKYNKRLNEALKDKAFLSIIDNNQNVAREILQWIADNSLSDSQIMIIQTNMTQLTPYFEQYWMRDQVYRCIQTRGWRYNRSYQNYWNMDLETAYKTWWITGWLNNLLMKAFPNAKPEQVSNFTNIAVAAGWIYAIYRIWKWFFGKNKEWNRNILWKTLWLASAYFVPQLLVWQDWYSLLWDILTWKADFWELWYRLSNCLRFMNNNSPEVYTQMAPWILWMSIFPQTYTVENIRSLQQTFSDQNTRKQRYSTTYNRLNKNNSALANEFKNTFNENQYNESEWKVFLAKLWITEKTSWDTIFFNEAAKIADKKTSFELRMKSQWKERNPAFKKEIDNYLKQNWEFNPDDVKNWLIEDNDAKYTMRKIDLENKETLNKKVDNLSLDSQKKSELKTALEEFYDERTIASKPNPNDFDLKIEDKFLILKSNWWHESKINLETKELDWFGPWINFTNLADLLNTADLANKILETQKGKITMWEPVFKYKPERKWICFNDANNLRKDVINWDNSWHDTRVLSTSRRWKIRLQNNQNIISNRPNEYADYLSSRRIEENKINIDISQYPNVKGLADSWIIFTNEKEIQELETRLKQIKELKKFSIWDLWWNPYKTTWQWFDTKLKFINVDWKKEVFAEDLAEKFPTIMANKDKFLAYMNNQRNWMRWSEITSRMNP